MRPRGEVRQAIGRAARELVAERAVQAGTFDVAGATWREIAARACVGYDVARQTVKDMRRAKELKPIGTVSVSSSRRPMVLYAPTSPPAQRASLDVVMRSWSSA